VIIFNRTMNSFARKFLITDAERETERSSKYINDDRLSDAMWGSQAGFGHLVEGHAFNIPAVPDVRSSNLSFPFFNILPLFL
jgi:hypothetical protein